MCFAAQGHHECVKILATAKADINKSGRNGITAYFMACMSGDQKCIHILENYGAVLYHHECVQILATAKADIDKSGRNGITAMWQVW